jgi:adenosine deaminase
MSIAQVAAAACTAALLTLLRKRSRREAQFVGSAELHVHLDGSIRASTFLALYSTTNGGKPIETLEHIRTELCFRTDWDLPRCLASFSTTLSILQTESHLTRVTFELCEDLFADGVRYAEIRWCPSLHLQQGRSYEEVIDAVGAGISLANRLLPSAQFCQILTCLRDLGADEALRITTLAANDENNSVVGVDLAGNEYEHPPELFQQAFEVAHKAGLGITIHAGEGTSEQAAQNIVNAVKLCHATRIGHGVAARGRPEILRLLRENCVAIECCPTSNVHTGSIKEVKDHPAMEFYRAGITCIPCADNTLLSQTTTCCEFEIFKRQLGFSANELRDLKQRARDAGFVACSPRDRA